MAVDDLWPQDCDYVTINIIVDDLWPQDCDYVTTNIFVDDLWLQDWLELKFNRSPNSQLCQQV